MLEPFAYDYAQLVFASTMAVVQFAAARNRLYGLMLLRRWPRLTQVLSAATLFAAFVWFFAASGPRNIPDTGVGLEANTQTGVFALAAAVAIVATVVASSIANHRWGAAHAPDADAVDWPVPGFGTLEQTTFARALIARLRAAARQVR